VNVVIISFIVAPCMLL